MKKITLVSSVVLACAVMLMFVFRPMGANASDTICDGIKIDAIDVSGMTAEQAREAIEQYVQSLSSCEITFVAAQDTCVQSTFGELGIMWNNPEVIDEVFNAVAKGNVVQRYKAMKDIQMNGATYGLDITFDENRVNQFLTENCVQYDIPVSDASLVRENGEFEIVGGNPGQVLNVEASVANIKENLYSYYKDGMTQMSLQVDELQPEGSVAELQQVKDLLATFTTSFSTSGSNRSANVINGCSLINGTTIYPGEEFSVYGAVSPFTEDNGYYLAGSYLNGQVVDSVGGGICQVSSTLYNAVLRAELEVTERHPHSMIVSYVQKSSDAAIAESSGKDFKFINSTDHPIYIEGFTEDKKITFNIYGVETRPDSHSIEFESEVLSETVPETVTLVANPSAPIGTFTTESAAHTGYRAKLWKIVYENGEEVSREEVNSSTYNPSPKTVSVGTASNYPELSSQMSAALASGDMEYCQAVAANLQAQEANANAQQQALQQALLLQQQQATP